MKTILSVLDKRSSVSIYLLSVIIVVAVSTLSIALGATTELEPFCIFAILLSSWYGSSKSGVIIALFSTVALVFVKASVSQFSINALDILLVSSPNAVVYIILALIVTNFRDVHRVEVTAADTDNLTGICNARSFYAGLTNELLRSRRYKHIFSIAYIDVDNFKAINDSLGHSVGDRLLTEVADCLKLSLRRSDMVARLGGDEYICLLPETEQDEAKSAFIKVSSLLKKTMKKQGWTVGFSIGLVTFQTLPEDINEAMEIADKLMYSVKNTKKDNIAYEVWHGKT